MTNNELIEQLSVQIKGRDIAEKRLDELCMLIIETSSFWAGENECKNPLLKRLRTLAGLYRDNIKTLNEHGFDYNELQVRAKNLGNFENDDSIPERFYDVDALKTAIQWLRFWAQFPIKMVPWY